MVFIMLNCVVILLCLRLIYVDCLLNVYVFALCCSAAHGETLSCFTIYVNTAADDNKATFNLEPLYVPTYISNGDTVLG